MFGQAQRMDSIFDIEPAVEGNKRERWKQSSKIFFNFTDMGQTGKVTDNARVQKSGSEEEGDKQGHH